MKQVSGKEFVKILERHGWRLLRINGSHHIMGKDGRSEGLLRHHMKIAGLEESDL